MASAASMGVWQAEAVGGRLGSGSSISLGHPGPQFPHLPMQVFGQDRWFLTERGASFATTGHLAASGEIRVCHSFGEGRCTYLASGRRGQGGADQPAVRRSQDLCCPRLHLCDPTQLPTACQGSPWHVLLSQVAPGDIQDVCVPARWDRCGRMAFPRSDAGRQRGARQGR